MSRTLTHQSVAVLLIIIFIVTSDKETGYNVVDIAHNKNIEEHITCVSTSGIGNSVRAVLHCIYK